MPINPVAKLLYKIFNKKNYQDFKYRGKLKERIKYYDTKIYDEIVKMQSVIENKKELSFLHSGHLGDIIYSFPAIKELSKNHKCNLYIQVNKPMPLSYHNHPSGKVFLDKRIVELALPLFKSQNFLNSANIYNGEKIDINLDIFRDVPINARFHSIRWYFHVVGVQVNMENPFLSVQPHNLIKNKIILVRSPRYRNEYINYRFLKNTKNILCVGLKSEFEDIKKEVQHLEFHDCKDFLEMAKIIRAGKFFLGNLCFSYSIAEGLKVPRLLEANPDFPVVYPVGSNAYDFYHQNHFEKFFKLLNS